MLHHVSVGVRDVVRAAAFYDRVLGALGYRRVLEVMPYGIGYGDKTPAFWVQLPHDRSSPASAGNGVHIGFIGTSKAAIEDFHRAALAAGGSDEGGPGPRPDYGPDYFGAFVRDLDGNKLEAVLAVMPRTQRAAPAKKKGAKKANARRSGKRAGKASRNKARKGKKARGR